MTDLNNMLGVIVIIALAVAVFVLMIHGRSERKAAETYSSDTSDEQPTILRVTLQPRSGEFPTETFNIDSWHITKHGTLYIELDREGDAAVVYAHGSWFRVEEL